MSIDRPNLKYNYDSGLVMRPSRSDKDAYEIAKVWVNGGHSVATKELNAVADRNKLTKCAILMLADKVRHHHWVLLDKTNGAI